MEYVHPEHRDERRERVSHYKAEGVYPGQQHYYRDEEEEQYYGQERRRGAPMRGGRARGAPFVS
jgi:hypothetical protein